MPAPKNPALRNFTAKHLSSRSASESHQGPKHPLKHKPRLTTNMQPSQLLNHMSAFSKDEKVQTQSCNAGWLEEGHRLQEGAAPPQEYAYKTSWVEACMESKFSSSQPYPLCLAHVLPQQMLHYGDEPRSQHCARCCTNPV